jgi:hypothetical protein
MESLIKEQFTKSIPADAKIVSRTVRDRGSNQGNFQRDDHRASLVVKFCAVILPETAAQIRAVRRF